MIRSARALAAAALGVVLAASGGSARACGIELVLAIDVSRSVLNHEYDLQVGGLAAAFRDADVQDTLRSVPGGVMATVTQWSGPGSQRQSIGWTHLTDAQSATDFAGRIERMDRAFYAAFTAIGEALVHAAAVGGTNPRTCGRRIVDVSGDGVSNRGRPVANAADVLAASGITVNALVIRGARPDPLPHYRAQVIRGPGAFVEVADGFEDFPRAIRAKLLRELTPQLAAR